MATLKITTMVGRHGAWMAVVLGILFLSAGVSRAQEEASPARAVQTLQEAMKLHKAHDYENAARYFASLQPVQQILPEAGQRDFTYFNTLNTIALHGRQEGAAQIQLAANALKDNRLPEAGNLLKSLDANQFLAPADRQQVNDLNSKLQTQSAMAQPQGKGDAKSLLAAGRLALQQAISRPPTLWRRKPTRPVR